MVLNDITLERLFFSNMDNSCFFWLKKDKTEYIQKSFQILLLKLKHMSMQRLPNRNKLVRQKINQADNKKSALLR